MTQPIIFAALEDWCWDPEPPGLPAIRQVAALTPLVWVTQRSGAEVIDFNTTVGKPLPFIAEGGSVLYLPQSSESFMPADGDEPEAMGDYWAIALAGPYVQARAGLRVLANELHHSLLGYGDMTIDRLQKFTGLSTAATQRAKARESSEPFLTPKAVTADALTAAAEDLGFSVIYGERVSYLLAEGVSLAGAIAQLLDRCQLDLGASSATAGLGRWPTDQSLLTTVNRPMVIVPAAADPPPAQWSTTTATPEAWASALLSLAGLDPAD